MNKSTTLMNDIEARIQKLSTERDTNGRPIWVRAPKDGAVEHYSGLGKGVLYALDAHGHIRSACLKRPGCVRGVRLFNLQSILDYIEKRSSEDNRSSPAKISGGLS